MSTLSTHVLDTALGRPAAGVPVRLERTAPGGGIEVLAHATTDDDGRVAGLGPDLLESGRYRLVFDIEAYAERTDRDRFFPEVSVTFEVDEPTEHYHVPLLLSPYSYTTYRGS
jgi:5-hydroxyisourate hydrolase